MEYTEEVLASSGIICATVTGRIDPERLANLGKQTRKRAYASDLGFLLDLIRATDFPSIINVHNWFDDYYDRVDLHLKTVPTAHLGSPSDIELLEFIETSWTNRGAIVRAFTDREAALKWLESCPKRTS